MHTHGISIVVDMGVGALVAGKYRIERIISEGGMGCVVAARHTDLDELVAIKFLLPSALGNADAVARFAQEARTAVKIRSEHVVRTLDVGTLDNGTPFIVMEYLDGSDLSVVLREQGRLPVEQAVDFVLQTSEAIAEAHRMGIVHRDLKPANLFCIRQPGGTFLIKVLDFGISKVTNTQVAHPLAVTTNTATIMGSPFYMSPEQLRSSRSVDVRSDIWSLGVILFELTSGHLPFEAETLPELCLDITTKPPARLREYRPDIEPELESVICKCLEKDRDARYSNIAELALALTPFAPKRRSSSIERVCGVVACSGTPARAVSGATLLRNSDDRLLAAVPVDWFGSRDTRALHSAPIQSSSLACSQLRVAPVTSHAENEMENGATSLPTEASVFPAVLHSTTDRNDTSQFLAGFEKPRRAKWRRRLLGTLFALVVTVGAVRALAPLQPAQTRVQELATHALALLQSPQDTITVTAAGPGLIPIESVEVFIDGKKRCDSSPCVATRVGIGTHLIAIKAAGYLTPSSQAVAAGNHLNLLLTPVPDSGYLKVSATGPDLKLTLDGRDMGTLGTELQTLSPGAHHLRIDGGRCLASYEQTVWVTPNQVTTIGPIRLQVLRGTAELVAGANTEHASLSLVAGRERRPVAALPHRVELEPARGYVLVATRRGFRTTTIPLTFEDGVAQKQFVVSLRKWGDQGPVAEKSIAQQDGTTKKPVSPPMEVGTAEANTRSPAFPPTTGVDSPVAVEKAPMSSVESPTESPAPNTAFSFDGESRGTEFGATATALLSINSIPHSNVLLDGRPLGATPRADVAVAPGEHVLTFVHPELGRKQIVVTAIAGKALVAAVRFP